MKLTPWFLAAIAPIAVAGCSGMLLGHFAVLAVTLGIFWGTLSLGNQTVETAPATGVAVLTHQGAHQAEPSSLPSLPSLPSVSAVAAVVGGTAGVEES